MRAHQVACLAMAVVMKSTGVHAAGANVALDATNPHYLKVNGRATVLVTSGEHYGSIINPDFDYHRYLDTLSRDGLNLTRLFGGSYVEVPGKSFTIQRNTLAPGAGRLLVPWARSNAPGYAGGGNKFDLQSWNPAYFARLHDFLYEAQKRGIVVELSLFSSQYGDEQWRMSPLNPANNVNMPDNVDWRDVNTLHNGPVLAAQERYARKLVHELAAHENVYIELCNEPWSDRPVHAGLIHPYLFPPARDQFPNVVELPDSDTLAWQAEVARWVADEESQLPRRHLVAQGWSNFRLPVGAALSGASVLNFHYAYPEAAAMNLGLGKAIAYDESGFLGQDDAAYAREAWRFVFAGGAVFDGLDYSFTTGHEDGRDTVPNGPGGGSPELRRQLGILSRTVNALPLERMQPAASLVVHAGGAQLQLLASTRGEYAGYLDGQPQGPLRLRLAAGRYQARWIDARTGEPSTERDLRHGGGELALIAPPGPAVLVLTRRPH